jgi:farnesyl-diphosphate farnesyltransferase
MGCSSFRLHEAFVCTPIRSDNVSRTPAISADAADISFCHSAVQGVSRTFAITVDVLDDPMSTYICVGYLVCRIADTVEDAGHVPPAEKMRLLRCYDAVLDPDDDTEAAAFVDAVRPYIPPDPTDEWALVAAAPRVLRVFDSFPPAVQAAIIPPARELVQGMAEFIDRYAAIGGLRVQSKEELERYCYYAAGTVGKLITNLLTRGGVSPARRQLLYDTAVEFGLLLQLVNISKDVHADFTDEDNVYLPAEWLQEVGVRQDAVIDADNQSAVASVVRRTARFAGSHLGDAERYLRALPLVDGNTLAAWAIPFLLAVGTLRELMTRPEDALRTDGVKVSHEEVYAVIAAMEDDVDAASLERMRQQISERPFHTHPGPSVGG